MGYLIPEVASGDWAIEIINPHLSPHVSPTTLIGTLAPQVEFELLEGMQQQNTSWTRHQVVCIVFKEIVQLYS